MRSSRVSILARFGSAAAVAGLALAGALAPVSASAATAHHAHHRLSSHLFIRDHAVPKTGHKSDAIIGLLRSHGHGLAGRTVTLFSRMAHAKFAAVGSAKTGKHGAVKFTVTPTARTHYVLVFKGGPKFRGSHSAVVVLRAPKA